MIELNTEEDLETCLARSEREPVFLYKHSTACSTSASAHRRLRAYLSAAPPSTPPFHLVKVIESRLVSNRIAEVLGVRHQSPQLILVQGRRAIWETSHGQITAESIAQALGNHR
ncbi:bacillithiol system redox-active protein YtxJ [Candidatus Sumerlaeota bacterium]|nr:bacillithiol system redox-active protein YtxJ [Candidatus Sumerlaeota bacterium]